MANEYRNPQRGYRTSGDDWREDVDFRQQRDQDYEDDYQGTRSRFDRDSRSDYRSAASYRGRRDDPNDYSNEGNRTNWRRRSVNEMEDDSYSSGFGSDAANLGTGSYGASGYNPYRVRDYGDYGYYRGGARGMRDSRQNSRPSQSDYGSYSSDYGYQDNNPQSSWYTSPYYRGDYGTYNRPRYSNYDQDRYRNEDRNWWDRTTDEVSSWFGDEDAERRRRMDKHQNFKGVGPKGYKRSDDRIKEDINDRLTDDPFIDASDIDVSVNNCEVTLSGKVYDRSTKRRAEDLVESVSGVLHVENRIRVNREDQADYKYPTAATTGGSTNTNSRAEDGKTKSSSSRAI